ncbi:MAG: TetR/AcrR family transcriptional regulator [Acidobacteriota bacterium]|nr:TetR/AcrR family transcriptional regulator [Acidobacteriota bacterium]
MTPVSPAPHPRLSGRMSGDDRRLQLIEVAIDLFSRKGFGGTTTREIAAAAGVTEAIIFRHFATKQDLYKAILDHKHGASGKREWLAEVQVFMDARDDEGLFRYLVSTIIALHREEPRFERLLLHAALEGHELAIMHHNQIAANVGVKFVEYIARRQRAGAIRRCDPTIVIFALVGIAKHYAMQKYMYQRCELTITDDQMVDGFLAIVMNGIRTTPPNRTTTPRKLQ